MKKIMQTGFALFLTAAVLLLSVCNENNDNHVISGEQGGAMISSLKIAQFPVTLGNPWTTTEGADEGSVTIKGPWADSVVHNPKFSIIHAGNAAIQYAVGAKPNNFASARPDSLPNGSILWIKVTAQGNEEVSYYKIKVTVENSNEGYGVKDAAWASDPYNAEHRIFPNAPEYGILTYDDINANAPVTYWNTKGHNHKYPDLFHFANGNKVETLADWENRRSEIFNILQYYMHGRMPSIDSDVLNIIWRDRVVNGNNQCDISLKNLANGKTANISIVHTPPAGAGEGARDKILLFGVGMPPAARNGWGRAVFQTTWGGAENDRSGTCVALYGLSLSSSDTPSVNMEYAWAMSVILTVIEQGGLGGYYDPSKVGIYGFSRWGKAAMCIGAFAESRGGNRIGQTFIGSAGSGGPAIDRWINQMGYKSHTEDPLPVDGDGINTSNQYTGITWYMRNLTDTPAAGSVNREVVRGWNASTPGIPVGSLEYGEGDGETKNPGPPNSWGRIQVLSQARGEVPGWFSGRFGSLRDLHSGALLDQNSGGVVCTMPFDAHFISALIAPRVVYFEDGYNTMRNNPEGQWANWLMVDEVYQMFAEKLNDPSIIWRNAIKLYDIEHGHQAYQDVDEYELTTAIYSNLQPDAKFRTPPFPADDPRYRWDFNRMDWGRPGHPTIAERVRLMRENPVKVKAVDTRGLLDSPEQL
ncbi:glucuronyl esterase domain-containing protein [Treponema sp. R80B11-R83G3]